MLRFLVGHLDPFPLEPDLEVEILAALAHQLPAEADPEAMFGPVFAALIGTGPRSACGAS